jgi:DNA polymerase-4
LFAALRLPHFPAQALLLKPEVRKAGNAFAVVEQNADSGKTPLMAVSALAREQGVRPGMPWFLALRKWPRLAVYPRDANAEMRLRAMLADGCERFTPVHAIGDDGGALLDMTGTPCAREAPGFWLRRLDADLGVRVPGLEAIYGAASSQMLAKVLARLGQPGEIRACPAGLEMETLDPLPPQILPGLSPRTRELLRKYGLDTVAKIRAVGREALNLRFGGEGEKLYALCRGLDLDVSLPRRMALRVERVLSADLNDGDALRGQVRETADKLGHALRSSGRVAGQITLELVYADGRHARRSAPLHPPAAAYAALTAAAEGLFAALYQRRVALRRIRLFALRPQADTGQVDLFDSDWARKQEALGQAIARIRDKRSFEAVFRAAAALGSPRPSGRIKNPRNAGRASRSPLGPSP